MIKKKARKKAAKKSGKRRASCKKPVDPAVVRQQIAEMVKAEAKDITEAVINEAIQGELAPAKYLLEMAGVYPASNDGDIATKEEESLAETLLRRLDIPTTPVVQDEEEDVVIRRLPAAENEDDEGPSSVKSEEESEEKETAGMALVERGDRE